MWIPSLVPIWHFLMPRANSSLQNFIAPLVRLNPHIGSWPASTRFKQLPMHVHVPYIKNVFKICVQLFETSYQKLQFQPKLGVFHINDPEYDQDHPENLKLVPWGTDGRLPLSDLDLDLGSGHTAYRRASLIDLYLRTKFHWDRKQNFFESHHRGFGQVQSHVTQKLGKISKIRPHQI